MNQRIVIAIFVCIFAGLWGFTIIAFIFGHRSDTAVLIALLLLILTYVTAIIGLNILVGINLWRLDLNGFIKDARILSLLSFPDDERKHFWNSHATAMSQYLRGDLKVAEETMSYWQNNLRGHELDYHLRIQLAARCFVCDTNGIIETGLQMSRQKKFLAAHKLIVAVAYFRNGQPEKAIDLLDSILDGRVVNAKVLNVYFARFYAQMGCDAELNNLLHYLEKNFKYPIEENGWKTALLGYCAAAKGEREQSARLLIQALKSIHIPSTLDESSKSEAIIAFMSVKNIENALTKLEDYSDSYIAETRNNNMRFKRIAKRLGVAA